MKRRRFTWLVCSVGLLLIVAGMVFTPSFVAAYVKRVDVLHPITANRVMLAQLGLISLGCLTVFGSVCLHGMRYGAVAFVPVLIVYSALAYTFYLDKKYPKNEFLTPSEYAKAWRLLNGESITLSDFQPRASLIVNNRQVTKARHPVIDMHFHLGSLRNIGADELVDAMNTHGIAKIVNLDGSPDELKKYTAEFSERYPDRFVMFVRPNLRLLESPNGPHDLVAVVEGAVRSGARGVKITKELGLTWQDKSGAVVAIDDPRLDALWAKAGELRVPILMHVTDPTPFFDPVDRFNERYEELNEFPEWSFYGPMFPTKETLLLQREHVLRKHPSTTFIGAHVGDNPEDLAYVSALLDKYPNYYVDIASRLPELGRQPFTARDFFIKYQDRIVFGTDGGYALGGEGWSFEKFFGTYFAFLETRNEYFEYPLSGINRQGRWQIYGLDLPDEVLAKIYHLNAERLLGHEKRK